MKVELPDSAGENVISISVVRKTRFSRDCRHRQVEVDPVLAEVECKSCGKNVNPIEWIAMMAEEWDRVKELYRLHKDAADVWEEKQRTQCQFCKRITPVNAPSEFSQKMRKRGHVV